MRVLVEQTTANVKQWLQQLRIYGVDGESDRIAVHLLMGGEPEVRTAPWTHHPEQDAILIGTQDMLLSRALMRGYGMSRYQWPVHFALLHNDALWIFDEVQLMGPALATTSQLEGFRRNSMAASAKPARSLWLSATLNRDWLSTVDLRPYADKLQTLELSEEETHTPSIRQRREAVKPLHKAETRLQNAHTKKIGIKAYADALATEILQAHSTEDGNTLIVLNTVDRAQAVFDAILRQTPDTNALLIHARFRPAERRFIEGRLRESPESGRVIVATQAIEAGVDITSRRLFTELAPWTSLVQRFGRCNRYGESDHTAVYWIDMEADDKLTAPYEVNVLNAARARLQALDRVNPAYLPPADNAAPTGMVLRRKDLSELFNTEADLSGFDIDISPYIRDIGTPQLQVFWRTFNDAPEEQGQPRRDELCPASLNQIKEHIGNKRAAYVWDALAGDWRRTRTFRPGMTVLVRAADGGYDAERGFLAGSKAPVAPVGEPDVNVASYDGEPDSSIGRFVELGEHLGDVADEAEKICQSLGVDEYSTSAIVTASRWHDLGKVHEAFQTALIKAARNVPPSMDVFWAKSDGRGRLEYQVAGANGKPVSRRHFRHELASMLTWLANGECNEKHDLIAYLIAAHHGKVRMGLRALPDESSPKDERRFARGVWEGDRLPAFNLGNWSIPETELRLSIMELGSGEQGPSWTERTQRLLSTHGPFELAWLEALVRIADWRASRMEQEQSNTQISSSHREITDAT